MITAACSISPTNQFIILTFLRSKRPSSLLARRPPYPHIQRVQNSLGLIMLPRVLCALVFRAVDLSPSAAGEDSALVGQDFVAVLVLAAVDLVGVEDQAAKAVPEKIVRDFS